MSTSMALTGAPEAAASQSSQSRLALQKEYLRAISGVTNIGSRYEGDVFSVLMKSPYVVRSFELALVDGAVDCTNAFNEPDSWNYADRLWTAEYRQQNPDPRQVPSEFLPFDVKSVTASPAGHQEFVSSAQQMRYVAFYICIYANDPTFAALIPNYHQEDPSAKIERESYKVFSICTSAQNRLKPSTYRIDPSTAACQMPIALLPEAIRRVRLHAQGLAQYVNPWTRAIFKGWSPRTSQSTDFLRPGEHTQNFAAYLAAAKIYHSVSTKPRDFPLKFDMVGVQPSLADFKFVFEDAKSSTKSQVFIQHKLDSHDRRVSTPLEKVAVGRNRNKPNTTKSTDGGADIRWYFTGEDRQVVTR